MDDDVVRASKGMTNATMVTKAAVVCKVTVV
jgi:hypothetical protein